MTGLITAIISSKSPTCFFSRWQMRREWKFRKGATGRSCGTQAVLILSTDTLMYFGRLERRKGILGDIYTEAQSRFNNPVNLKKLINLIDEIEWTSLGVDVKAQAYEGLLEKAASEGKKGAGQYFTPRVLIQSIVRCMKPDPRVHNEFTICDPACGTGGFLVASYEWLVGETKGGALPKEIAKRVKSKTYHGQDLVARPRRLALMNLYLHGIEPQIRLRRHNL